jgi:dihydroxycyclohexadiene carboxylate dehydrogenase
VTASHTFTGRFDDKVVVVTGAAQGIGKGVAERIAAEGGRLVLGDRSPLVKETAEAIAEAGGAALPHECDLEQYDGAASLVDTALTEHGRIDVLINNVGGTIWTRPYEEYDVPAIEQEVRRSLFPTLWCCRAALPHMVARGSGTIVNVSSIATRSIHRVPYAASKGGVNALTAALAFEAGAKGVRVVATAPGGTEAPPRRIPRNEDLLGERDRAWYEQIVDQTVASTHVGRYSTLDEQVAPIVFLASDEASYITGSVLPVGGGDQG